MKILVVSHNVFSKTNNMGKTLSSYFKGIDSTDIAQFYIHSEIPVDALCENYYRITDRDAIKSILTRRSGRIFGRSDVKTNATHSRTDTGTAAKLYQKAKKRSPFIYFVRNLWWTLGAWKTKQLRLWLDEFAPDIIFFASGDYAFMYKIALWMAKYTKVPLTVSCMDDYYFYNKNENRFGGKFVHKQFMKQVKKTMAYASCIFPICEKMGEEYGEFFQKPYHTLHTSSTISQPLQASKTNAISYIGNLGYKRNEQLVVLGRTLKNLNIKGKPEYIDVYSGEKTPEILKDLTEENGIRFHGSISADRVLEVMGKSLAVIHTESFEDSPKRSMAYSVSTKIADSLMSGTCIFAFGPKDVASMEYLSENEAALCILSEDQLADGFEELIVNEQARNRVIANAIQLACKNHMASKNLVMIMDAMRLYL